MNWSIRAAVLILIFVIGFQHFAECGTTVRSNSQRSNTVKTTTPRPRVNCAENVQRDYNDPRQAVGKSPISRLYEIQAKNYASAPVFKELEQRVPANKSREFHIQVTVNDKTTSAWASTKKDAKRRAAIEMLTLMGVPVEAEHSNSINHC